MRRIQRSSAGDRETRALCHENITFGCVVIWMSRFPGRCSKLQRKFSVDKVQWRNRNAYALRFSNTSYWPDEGTWRKMTSVIFYFRFETFVSLSHAFCLSFLIGLFSSGYHKAHQMVLSNWCKWTKTKPAVTCVGKQNFQNNFECTKGSFPFDGVLSLVGAIIAIIGLERFFG